MKYLNYVLSMILCIACSYLFVKSKTDYDIVVSFTVMMSGIVFFLFALLEENKEEIKRLRQIILNQRDFK